MKLSYALATLAVLATEVLIARFVHDAVVRPYVGDALAVILVYLALRAVTPLKLGRALTASVGVATAIELGQLFRLLDALHLRGNPLAGFVLGGTFDVKDFLAYGAGATAAGAFEVVVKRFRFDARTSS